MTGSVTTATPQPLPYGTWPSPISAASVVAGVVGLSEVTAREGSLYWLESRPEENGRSVLVVQPLEGEPRDLTPSPYNVRSRVHEYGGGPYLVRDDIVCFVNFADQNLYRVAPDGAIEQITQGTPDARFADLCGDPQRNRLLAVTEHHHADREPDNRLSAVDLSTGAVTTLQADHDFYACPRLSPDGTRLAFISWDHPNMPWDGTCLNIAGIGPTGELTSITRVAGGVDESVSQPQWLSDGALLFSSDSNGYANLYRFDESGLFCVLEDGADYTQPAWVFGLRDYTALDAAHIVAVRRTDGEQEMVLINSKTGLATPLNPAEIHCTSYAYLTAAEGALYFVAGFAERTPAIMSLSLADQRLALVRGSGGPEVKPAQIACGETVHYPTRDGASAHGFYYPPASPEWRGSEGERPPLLVMSHGGPTAAADSSLNFRIQYYTSRGWAVLDVNYRGSSGFGRSYRTALNGQWGVTDVNDCEDGVRYLVAQNLADPKRVAIRGGSAGGFTTLAALTTTHTFRCGASHYGIGDLNALAADTHKFESRYLHSLVGSKAALSERSPIHHVDQLSCPVIFFQGGEDRIVPPNQAEAMVASLRGKGIPVAYRLFPDEGHGFRSAANIVAAIDAEFAFFCRVFAIEPATPLTDLVIENDPTQQQAST